MKKYTIQYRRTTLRLDFNPRKGKCEACPNKRKTDLHHWRYAYETKEVKKNPLLALENTTELCFTCHRTANSVKHLFFDGPSCMIKLFKLAKIKRIVFEKVDKGYNLGITRTRDEGK